MLLRLLSLGMCGGLGGGIKLEVGIVLIINCIGFLVCLMILIVLLCEVLCRLCLLICR